MENMLPKFLLAILPMFLALFLSVLPDSEQSSTLAANSTTAAYDEPASENELDNYFVIPTNYETAYVTSIVY